jgi:Fe-S-cluster containining protein
MDTRDQSQQFLDSLPEIRPGEEFWFACHPDIGCFNACCGDLTMPLTPYDVLRLSGGLEMSSEEFIEDYTEPGCYDDTGFPLLHLRMEPGASRPCPFVTPQGCGVYEHRSSACRIYPLGRAARPALESMGESAGQELTEQYFIVREAHCRGFAEHRSWTVESWLSDQGIEPYNLMNDRYMRLMARYKAVARGAVLSEKHATMALLCLYQQDRFLDLIKNVDLFSRIRFIGTYADRLRQDVERAILESSEERLAFAFAWMELVLFGSASDLAPA